MSLWDWKTAKINMWAENKYKLLRSTSRVRQKQVI